MALSALLAASPVLLVLAAMLGLGWSAARAGLAGLLAAALVAPLAFGFGGGTAPGLARQFAGVAAEGAFTAATILWILWPALALHEHQERTGGIETLRAALGRLSNEPLLQALLVAWFLGLFLEGAAGFGTPVALAAPMLFGLGFSAPVAVVLALLGHALGVSFGALGTPVMAQVALTGLEPAAIAGRTALMHVALGGLMLAFLVRVARAPQESAMGGAAAAGWTALAGAAFLVPSVLIASWLGPELATLGAALLGGALFVVVLRMRVRQPVPAAGGLARALVPYGVLVLLVLLTRAWPAVREALAQAVLEWRWLGDYAGRMEWLTHPGTLLFVALVAGALLQRVPLAEVGSALAHAARRLVPVALALLAMLCLSRLMVHGGLIEALEDAAVRGLGQAYPLIAPAIGALGSFVTGSATASNVLFTSLQAQTAQALGLPVLALVAAQGAGAAIGNIVCPHNVVAGAATVGLAGREAEILRRTVLPCIGYLLLAGLALWWWVARAGGG